MRKIKIIGAKDGIISLLKTESPVISAIDSYLMTITEDIDRKHGWNSPSGVGGCPRANYFIRMKYPRDIQYQNPRSTRIFNNGDDVHERLQRYLLKSGLLRIKEAPVYNKEYRILGHTDGLMVINNTIVMLEIKSINDTYFNSLIEPIEHHRKQVTVYMYCMEKLRQRLLLGESTDSIINEYKDIVSSFLMSDKKHTREEKIERAVAEITAAVNLINQYKENRIESAIVLYENKNRQDLKEYAVAWDADLIKEILDSYVYLNKCVVEKKCPPTPSDKFPCRFCDYKSRCKQIDKENS